MPILCIDMIEIIQGTQQNVGEDGDNVTSKYAEINAIESKLNRMKGTYKDVANEISINIVDSL